MPIYIIHVEVLCAPYFSSKYLYIKDTITQVLKCSIEYQLITTFNCYDGQARVDICHDCRDDRLFKSSDSCVNFSEISKQILALTVSLITSLCTQILLYVYVYTSCLKTCETGIAFGIIRFHTTFLCYCICKRIKSVID